MVGDIDVASKKYAFKPGKLVQAILNNASGLVLIDAPWDDSAFQYFMTCLTVQKGLWVNGEWLALPKDFTFHSEPAPPLKCPPEVKFTPKEAWQPDQEDSPEDIFYLNSHTLPFLFKQQQIEKEAWYTQHGWLETFDSKLKKIVQTGPLTEGELRHAYDAIQAASIKQTFSKCFFSWIDLTQTKPAPTPEAKGFLPAAWTQEKQLIGAHLLEVSDPAFVAQQLPLKADLIIPIHAYTTSADILEHLEECSRQSVTSGKSDELHFKVTVHKVATALRAGKTVILHGELSEELYRALESLFSPTPYLKLSEDKAPQPITGRLLIVSKPVTFSPHLAFYTQRHANYATVNLWPQYETQLKNEDSTFSREDFQKIRLFYQLAAKLPHGNIGVPPDLRLTYARVRQYLYLLKTHAHQDNPIKSCFLEDYQDPEIRAYLNVLAKLILGPAKQAPGVRKEKLVHLNEEGAHFWQRLNCLNSGALRALLFNAPTFSVTDPAPLKILETFDFHVASDVNRDWASIWKKAASYPPIKKSKKDAQEKIAAQMDIHLRDCRAVYLQGPPGTGKTYTAQTYAGQLGREAFWAGSDQEILAWLTADQKNPDTEHVLIVDEANLKTPGTWEFLRPLITLDTQKRKKIRLSMP